MITRILNRLFKHRVIVNCDHDPYLTRWFLFRSMPLALYLHVFHRSDEDRALHVEASFDLTNWSPQFRLERYHSAPWQTVAWTIQTNNVSEFWRIRPCTNSL